MVYGRYLDKTLVIGIHYIDVDIIEPAVGRWRGTLLEKAMVGMPRTFQFKHMRRDEPRSLSQQVVCPKLVMCACHPKLVDILKPDRGDPPLPDKNWNKGCQQFQSLAPNLVPTGIDMAAERERIFLDDKCPCLLTVQLQGIEHNAH